MVSAFTRTLGRSYSPVAQPCLALYLACELARAPLPPVAALLSSWLCWLPVPVFPIAFCPLSPAAQVSRCFPAPQCFPDLFQISFLTLFPCNKVSHVFYTIKFLQPDFEQPCELMRRLSYGNPLSGTELILTKKNVHCSSWGWQKSLFTLLVSSQMFASHMSAHKNIRQKELTSV